MKNTFFTHIISHRHAFDRKTFKRILHQIKHIKSLLSFVFDQQLKELFITNIEESLEKKEREYCLVIDREKIEYIAQTEVSKVTRCLDLVTGAYRVNNDDVDLAQLDHFFQYIQRGITDLEQGKAQAFATT